MLFLNKYSQYRKFIKFSLKKMKIFFGTGRRTDYHPSILTNNRYGKKGYSDSIALIFRTILCVLLVPNILKVVA